MTAFFITLSALFIALSNFLIRRGMGDSDQEKAGGDRFIMPRFFTAALVSIPIIYLHHGMVTFDPRMGLVAVFAGALLGFLQYCLGKSLQYGPSGLTFIFASSVCVWPPLLMFFLFGEEFGHGYTLYNLVGSFLVIGGLYWMGKGGKQEESPSFNKWLIWVGIAYLATTLYYSLFQWRALLLKDNVPESIFLPFHSDATQGDLFMALTFFVAALSQLFIRGKKEISPTTKQGFFMSGICSGILCAVSTYFLLLGTECASSDTENALIFPLNTVMMILFCNIWASRFYNEKLIWPANTLALAGIAIAT